MEVYWVMLHVSAKRLPLWDTNTVKNVCGTNKSQTSKTMYFLVKKKTFPKWADAVHLGLVWRDTSCHYSFGGKQTNITLDISTSSCRMHIFRFSKFISYLSGLMWCLRPSLPQLTWCIICRISFDTYVYTAPARKNHVLVCCFFFLCVVVQTKQS